MPKNQKNFFAQKNPWSEVKDNLLGGYLPQYFQKVLMTYKPIFYVDCFAGKGKFDDGSLGSPLIALDARSICVNQTHQRNPIINCCFIDLYHAGDLENNISSYQFGSGYPKVISGRYENEIVQLLSAQSGSNVFLYIDPYGIKALDISLFDQFANIGSIEILINMNSFGFFRDACRAMSVPYHEEDSLDDLVEYDPTIVNPSPQSIQMLNGIAGGEYWQVIVRDYKNEQIDGFEAEKRFSYEYKQRLRRNYSYVLDMPIRLKPKHRPKYRMIHLSNHADGCLLMADNMSSRSDELFVDIQDKGQQQLFEQDTENMLIDINEIKRKVAAHIDRYPNQKNINTRLAIFFTENGVLCKSGQVCDAFKEMELAGTIEVTRNPAETNTGKQSTFFTESNGKSVIIQKRCP